MAALTMDINQEEFKLMRELIQKECGIQVEQDKVYLLESRLTKLVIENGCDSFLDFYKKAMDPAGLRIRNKIVDAMTTNETLWFRDDKPYKVLMSRIYPELAEKAKKGQMVRMWSAACSTGQEPYSMSMVAHEYARLNNVPALTTALKIHATDISPSVIMLAKLARYDKIAMSRGMWPEYQQRYFTGDEKVASPIDTVKRPVTFEQFNLQSPFHALGKFDVIFLRNVAIYFSKEFKQELFNKVADALHPGGYLFLGSSESLMGYQTPFKLQQHDNCLFYQKPL